MKLYLTNYKTKTKMATINAVRHAAQALEPDRKVLITACRDLVERVTTTGAPQYIGTAVDAVALEKAKGYLDAVEAHYHAGELVKEEDVPPTPEEAFEASSDTVARSALTLMAMSEGIPMRALVYSNALGRSTDDNFWGAVGDLLFRTFPVPGMENAEEDDDDGTGP